jgi:hypothetical protein
MIHTPKHMAGGAQQLELSAEERAMNGAPEGTLFVVEVLPRANVGSDHGSSFADKFDVPFVAH